MNISKYIAIFLWLFKTVQVFANNLPPNFSLQTVPLIKKDYDGYYLHLNDFRSEFFVISFCEGDEEKPCAMFSTLEKKIFIPYQNKKIKITVRACKYPRLEQNIEDLCSSFPFPAQNLGVVDDNKKFQKNIDYYINFQHHLQQLHLHLSYAYSYAFKNDIKDSSPYYPFSLSNRDFLARFATMPLEWNDLIIEIMILNSIQYNTENSLFLATSNAEEDFIKTRIDEIGSILDSAFRMTGQGLNFGINMSSSILSTGYNYASFAGNTAYSYAASAAKTVGNYSSLYKTQALIAYSAYSAYASAQQILDDGTRLPVAERLENSLKSYQLVQESRIVLDITATFKEPLENAIKSLDKQKEKITSSLNQFNELERSTISVEDRFRHKSEYQRIIKDIDTALEKIPNSVEQFLSNIENIKERVVERLKKENKSPSEQLQNFINYTEQLGDIKNTVRGITENLRIFTNESTALNSDKAAALKIIKENMPYLFPFKKGSPAWTSEIENNLNKATDEVITQVRAKASRANKETIENTIKKYLKEKDNLFKTELGLLIEAEIQYEENHSSGKDYLEDLHKKIDMHITNLKNLKTQEIQIIRGNKILIRFDYGENRELRYDTLNIDGTEYKELLPQNINVIDRFSLSYRKDTMDRVGLTSVNERISDTFSAISQQFHGVIDTLFIPVNQQHNISIWMKNFLALGGSSEESIFKQFKTQYDKNAVKIKEFFDSCTELSQFWSNPEDPQKISYRLITLLNYENNKDFWNSLWKEVQNSVKYKDIVAKIAISTVSDGGKMLHNQMIGNLSPYDEDINISKRGLIVSSIYNKSYLASLSTYLENEIPSAQERFKISQYILYEALEPKNTKIVQSTKQKILDAYGLEKLLGDIFEHIILDKTRELKKIADIDININSLAKGSLGKLTGNALKFVNQDIKLPANYDKNFIKSMIAKIPQDHAIFQDYKVKKKFRAKVGLADSENESEIINFIFDIQENSKNLEKSSDSLLSFFYLTEDLFSRAELELLVNNDKEYKKISKNILTARDNLIKIVRDRLANEKQN